MKPPLLGNAEYWAEHAKGVAEERARVKAIDELGLNEIYPHLVREAKYGDAPMTADELLERIRGGAGRWTT